MTQKLPKVDGFRAAAKKTAKGEFRSGRFTCHDAQWTGGTETDPLLATFTITADELAEAAASNLLWTDQDVQRGIRPALSPQPPKELSLAGGYPDAAQSLFYTENP